MSRWVSHREACLGPVHAQLPSGGVTVLQSRHSALRKGPATVRHDVRELADYLGSAEGRARSRVASSPALRRELADAAIAADVHYNLCLRIASMQAAGRIPNYEASMGKVFGTELTQRIARTAVSALGLYSNLWDEDDSRAPMAGRATREYVFSVPQTIAGGSSEVGRLDPAQHHRDARARAAEELTAQHSRAPVSVTDGLPPPPSPASRSSRRTPLSPAIAARDRDRAGQLLPAAAQREATPRQAARRVRTTVSAESDHDLVGALHGWHAGDGWASATRGRSGAAGCGRGGYRTRG